MAQALASGNEVRDWLLDLEEPGRGSGGTGRPGLERPSESGRIRAGLPVDLGIEIVALLRPPARPYGPHRRTGCLPLACRSAPA